MKIRMRVVSVEQFMSEQQGLYHEFGAQRAWPATRPPPPALTKVAMFEIEAMDNDGHPTSNWTLVIHDPKVALPFKVGNAVTLSIEADP